MMNLIHSSILLGKFQRQRRLAGYGPRGHKRVGHNSAAEHNKQRSTKEKKNDASRLPLWLLAA